MVPLKLCCVVAGLICLSQVDGLDTDVESDGFHETEVQGRQIPKQHHHSVHYRPPPAPPYVPIDPFQYTPTPAPPRYYNEPAQRTRTVIQESQPVIQTMERQREYYAAECGCVPFKYLS